MSIEDYRDKLVNNKEMYDLSKLHKDKRAELERVHSYECSSAVGIEEL